MPARRYPARLAELNGTIKQNPQNFKNRYMGEGVIPKDGQLVAPKSLSATAKKAWNTTVSALLEIGVISVTDFVQLENLFLMYDELLKARKAIKDFDSQPENADQFKQIEMRRKLNARLVSTQSLFNSMARDFGMTPVDRTKLPKGSDDEDADPLEVLIR